MPFRIDPNKPFDDEIRRAGLELIEEAITSLRDQPSGRHEAVHDARKRFKRLRALYRLVARAAPDFSKEENARFRDIARSLAFAREATALVETVEYLETFATSTTQGKALRSITTVLRKRRDHAIEHEAGLDDAIAAAIAGCEEARKRLKAVSLPDELKDVTRLVKTGWAKQRKRARKALADCHEQADVEHFHELRKAGQASLDASRPSAPPLAIGDARQAVRHQAAGGYPRTRARSLGPFSLCRPGTGAFRQWRATGSASRCNHSEAAGAARRWP
nr:CHAD domain-containing protein [Rhizobium sp. 28DA2]